MELRHIERRPGGTIPLRTPRRPSGSPDRVASLAPDLPVGDDTVRVGRLRLPRRAEITALLPPDEAAVRGSDRLPYREALKAAVSAHLAALPAPVAAALAVCERAVGAVGRKDHGHPSVHEAVGALRGLAREIEPGVLEEVGVDVEVAESRRFLEGFLMPTDNPPDLAARGQALLDRLERADPAPLEARAVVLDGPSLVAFARGGENIFIGGEVLALPEDEAAAILAHERAHLLDRHLPRAQVCAAVARNLAAGAAASPALAASLEVLGRLAQARLQREQEFLADAGGSRMLSRAGFDPAAMGRVLQRLQGDSPASPGPWDDHPPLSARLAALARLAGGAADPQGSSGPAARRSDVDA